MNINLIHNDISWNTSITMIDRETLYGRKTEQRKTATLLSDGETLIPVGGISHGWLNESGQWLEREDMIRVDERGNEIREHPSSFSVEIQLSAKAEPMDVLRHRIRHCYLLDDEACPDALRTELSRGIIYQIEFCYRRGLLPSSGFLLMSESQQIWLLVGDEYRFSMLLPQDAISLDNNDDSETELDFELGFENL